MNVKTVKTAITHAGCFHADDVVSSVFLKKLNPNINIIRLSDVGEKEKDTIYYDIGLGEFDHHQANRKLNMAGIPYSAFGLLWEEWGRDYLKQYGFNRVEQAFERFKQNVVYKIDQGDNLGYKEVEGFRENEMIKAFLPKWHEVIKNPSCYDEQFKKAVIFTDMIFENWMRRLYEEAELAEIENEQWEKAKLTATNGIAVLENNIPWRKMQRENPVDTLKIVIAENVRSGYSVSAVDPLTLHITPNEYLTFVHPSGFMGTANSLSNAIKAAKIIIANM